MSVDKFSGAASAEREGGLMHNIARILVVFSILLVACDAGETPATPEALGTMRSAGLLQPGPRRAVAAIACMGSLEADGSRSLHHEARFFSEGSASTTCAVRIASTEWLGSAEHPWGRTGQPGAVCMVDVEGGYWRFQLAQDHGSTIATRVQAGRFEEWLLACAQLTK
ncbi:hypothetical protein [Hyalangium sp.]|uniref:hypothetical protein n=1 Tax=Hyalangium sp. TaxID=2028555 RepID=UPI002D3FCDD7|nr:hypothetical protein [Hyalangium sp.]HYH96175.1 hypothetical protein [Hyalangium sp.]